MLWDWEKMLSSGVWDHGWAKFCSWVNSSCMQGYLCSRFHDCSYWHNSCMIIFFSFSKTAPSWSTFLWLTVSSIGLTCVAFNSNRADLSGFSNNIETYSPAVVWICPPRVLMPPWERLVSPWKRKVTCFMLTLVPPSIPFQSFNLGTVSRQRSPFNLHRGDGHKGTESPALPASSLSVRQRWHAKQSH